MRRRCCLPDRPELVWAVRDIVPVWSLTLENPSGEPREKRNSTRIQTHTTALLCLCTRTHGDRRISLFLQPVCRASGVTRKKRMKEAWMRNQPPPGHLLLCCLFYSSLEKAIISPARLTVSKNQIKSIRVSFLGTTDSWMVEGAEVDVVVRQRRPWQGPLWYRLTTSETLLQVCLNGTVEAGEKHGYITMWLMRGDLSTWTYLVEVDRVIKRKFPTTTSHHEQPS